MRQLLSALKNFQTIWRATPLKLSYGVSPSILISTLVRQKDKEKSMQSLDAWTKAAQNILTEEVVQLNLTRGHVLATYVLNYKT